MVNFIGLTNGNGYRSRSKTYETLWYSTCSWRTYWAGITSSPTWLHWPLYQWFKSGVEKTYGVTSFITARNTVTSSIHVSQMLECLIGHEGSLLIIWFSHIPTIMVPLIILALLEGRAWTFRWSLDLECWLKRLFPKLTPYSYCSPDSSPYMYTPR